MFESFWSPDENSSLLSQAIKDQLDLLEFNCFQAFLRSAGCCVYDCGLNLQAPRLSHDVLRKHTEINEHHRTDHVLVKQVQALAATHQQLAEQMQALIKILADQHTAANSHDLQHMSPFLIAAAVAMSLLLGILIAKFL